MSINSPYFSISFIFIFIVSALLLIAQKYDYGVYALIVGIILFSIIIFDNSIVMDNREFIYCEYSKTIRLMPFNYLVAIPLGNQWVLECDRELGPNFSNKICKTVYINSSEPKEKLLIELNKLIQYGKI